MIPLSEVVWGPINATEHDASFSSKWIEPPEIKNCLDHTCWIVTGEKGSGKSAIQRAMREIYGQDYYVTPLVDFDKVTFGLLYDNLIDLSQTTKLAAGVTLSNYWQYSIIVELIKACGKKDPDTYGDLIRDGSVAKHRDMPLHMRLVRLVEEAWNKVDDFTKGHESRKANLLASFGLDAKVLHDISTFPLGPEYEKVRAEFFTRIAANKHRVTLILDGFDTLITSDITAASVRLIFSSLVDAILSLRRNENLPDLIGIKALIPHDRFMGLSLRDSDKVDAFHTAIRWNADTLKEFVQKRILLTRGLKNGSFQSLWNQVMPHFVENSVHKVQENSFEYLLRHTMMRPRQLQIHLDTLAKAYRDENIDPSMVPKSVAESNKKLAKFFIDEYALDYKHLERMILSFERDCSVMPFKSLRQHVESSIRHEHGHKHKKNIEEEVDALYVMGLFGIVRFLEDGDARRDRYYPPTTQGRQHYVDFFFGAPDTRVSSRLTDETTVALHPIFVDFANLKPSSLIIG